MHLLRSQPFTCITSHSVIMTPFEVGGLSLPFPKRGNQGRRSKELARLPRPALVLGLASGRPGQYSRGHWRLARLGALAGPQRLSGSPPTAPRPGSSRKLHSCPLPRPRDSFAPLRCWPCWVLRPPMQALHPSPRLSQLSSWGALRLAPAGSRLTQALSNCVSGE